jgi:hypothetical protein
MFIISSMPSGKTELRYLHPFLKPAGGMTGNSGEYLC